jgi:hypothetical protein
MSVGGKHAPRIRPVASTCGPHPTALPDTCENLCLRASGGDAWQYDVILIDPAEQGRWAPA